MVADLPLQMQREQISRKYTSPCVSSDLLKESGTNTSSRPKHKSQMAPQTYFLPTPKKFRLSRKVATRKLLGKFRHQPTRSWHDCSSEHMTRCLVHGSFFIQ